MSMFSIVDYSIVSALGWDKAETRTSLSRGVAPGMTPLAGLVGNESTWFGFVPGWSARRPEALADGAFRVGALVEAAFRELAPAVAAAKARFGADRVGVCLGSSNSTMEEFTDRPDKIDMNFPSRHLAAVAGVTGPVLTVSTACSSSAKAFASARRLIEGGAADAVIVGGADAYTRTVVEGFHALEALSSRVCRPCAPDRDGITLGEGCALFVLTRASAAFRGVTFRGIGESSDAYHLTAPDPEGRGAEASMRAALTDAGLAPADVSFVNLHGTGTTYNDAMELAALRRVFTRGVCAFSTKPLTGHCLGAAGAIEAALTVLALENRSGIALSNSFAFGGSNATLVLAGTKSAII